MPDPAARGCNRGGCSTGAECRGARAAFPCLHKELLWQRKGPRNAPNLEAALGLNSRAEGFLKHPGKRCLARP